MKRLLSVTLILCSAFIVRAQVVDNSSTFRYIGRDNYFRFHYDNDYFTKSDEYYTQGVTFEVVHPAIKRFFVSKLLWTPYNTTAQYGVRLDVFGYTPTSIGSDSILYGDRPFENNISFATFSIQSDDVHHQQLSTAFTVGVMGPWALGKEIQTGIHGWLKDPLPHGWQYQIRNDVIINYQLNYEKQLLGADDHFLLNATTEVRLGTLNDKLSGGINFMAGRFNQRFVPVKQTHRKVEYYFYGQGRLHLIGYDASLQGGLFNRSSPYHIASADINRVVFEADAGVILNFNGLFLSYTQSYLTKEFRTGGYHRWGGVSVGFGL